MEEFESFDGLSIAAVKCLASGLQSAFRQWAACPLGKHVSAPHGSQIAD